ncbi:alpha/beta hydrolase [Amycolatopsis antarctica]|uniref:Alpha/beta hydrolase n=1 Tax=Amycolatopsis antarctica TaxID=1854586 RepID=A0A263D3Y5_9PSEU|nr:alpha/beta fold hydrolase [Amycolatopsis antarctica]OZM72337.1 alpha/beta hydrolase [Amycolatopsis antarctica]
MSEDVPSLSVRRAAGPAKAVVLVLHGGAEWGQSAVHPWRLAYLRMVPLARDIHQAGHEHGVAVWLLRNRVRGWNAPDLDPVRDARWALDRIRAEHPGLPVVLVGHSMGGRTALRVADDPAVVGVCALAPWTPGPEPVTGVRGKDVLIVHGTRDRMTDPADSYSFATRAAAGSARLARFEIEAEGHAMLRRSAVWTRLASTFTLETLGLPTSDRSVTAAWTKPDDQRLRIPVQQTEK